MDPVTGIGLAASLVTLVGLATQGCTRLHDLRTRFKNAKAELHRLANDVEMLKLLLSEVEKTSHDIGSAALSPELRSIWRTNECKLRKDLTSFTEIIDRLKIHAEGSSKARKLGRMRFAVSDKQILKSRLAFRGHIEMLNFVQGLLTSRQIAHVHAKLGITEVKILGRLDNGLGLIEDEVNAINKTLSKPRTPTSLVERELLNVFTHTHGTFDSENEIYVGPKATHRRQKMVYWKWAIYRLPIGTLTTELAHSGQKFKEQEPGAGTSYTVTFKLQPPAWITQVVFQISYAVKVDNLGYKLPYWQRTQCGSASLIPTELLKYMGDEDFLAAASCLSTMSVWDIQELCRREAFYDMFGDITWQLMSHFDFMNSGQSNLRQELVIDFNDIDRPSRKRYGSIGSK